MPGLREMRRVTQPGGQIWCWSSFATSRRGATRRSSSISATCCRASAGSSRRTPGAYSYLPRSVGRFATRRQFAALLEHAGYGDIELREQSLGIATLFLARAR